MAYVIPNWIIFSERMDLSENLEDVPEIDLDLPAIKKDISRVLKVIPPHQLLGFLSFCFGSGSKRENYTDPDPHPRNVGYFVTSGSSRQN